MRAQRMSHTAYRRGDRQGDLHKYAGLLRAKMHAYAADRVRRVGLCGNEFGPCLGPSYWDAEHRGEEALRIPLAPRSQQGHAWLPRICCNGTMSGHESARRFATALDQLGSSHPVVRVGCFAEMDRLVAEDPEYAQPVADVVTAYLRMPFDPPRFDRSYSRSLMLLPKVPDEPPMSQAPGFPELQVRLAAQAVLTRRLLPEVAQQADQGDGGEAAVPDVFIDLTGATLVGIDFTGRRLHDDVIFSHAGFHEYVKFSSATFTGGAWFRNAAFHGTVSFNGTQFQGIAMFECAKFIGWAGLPNFERRWSVLSGDFGHAQFRGRADFDSAEFRNHVIFDGAVVSNGSFLSSRFEDDASFCRVTFGLSNFGGASFARSPDFEGTGNLSGNVTVAGEPVRLRDDR